MFAECYSLETLTLPTGNVTALTTIQGMFKACYRLTALDLSGFTASQDTIADDLFLYADSLAELTLPAGVGVGDFMCLNNGDWYDGPPGWIVRGDATMTTVSGNGGYGDDAVIATAAQTTTYIWKSEVFGNLPALHLPGGTLTVAESAAEEFCFTNNLHFRPEIVLE